MYTVYVLLGVLDEMEERKRKKERKCLTPLPIRMCCFWFSMLWFGSYWSTALANRLNNIGIKHGFSCINIRQVPWEVLKTEAESCGFQHLPRDLANNNALKNHVRSLLLHKNWKHLLHFALFLALFCFAFSPMSRERNFHGLCSF